MNDFYEYTFHIIINTTYCTRSFNICIQLQCENRYLNRFLLFDFRWIVQK